LGKDLKEIAKELFAPVTKGVGINLPGTTAVAKKNKKKTKEKRDDHRLPDDMHFSSKQLVTLFLKPKFFVRYLCALTSYAC
jgi:condensin complex subunit 2